MEVSSPGAALNDIQHVRQIFPHANLEIVNRLGHANWKRRQHLINLRSQQDEASMREEIKLQLDVLGSDATLPNSPSDINSQHGYPPSKTNLSSIGEVSINDSSTGFSFERSRTSTDITSMIDLPKITTLPPSVQKQSRLRLPRPPPPSGVSNDQAFKCPYCFHNMLLTEHQSNWS